MRRRFQFRNLNTVLLLCLLISIVLCKKGTLVQHCCENLHSGSSTIISKQENFQTNSGHRRVRQQFPEILGKIKLLQKTLEIEVLG